MNYPILNHTSFRNRQRVIRLPLHLFETDRQTVHFHTQMLNLGFL